VQHAGVVIGRDRLPHHVYAGFPGDHPAVLRCRPFQVVTGACLLLRRSAFRAVGGFDLRYRNGHEDVDLCLRLREAGHEVRYCADAVLTHLESCPAAAPARTRSPTDGCGAAPGSTGSSPTTSSCTPPDGLLSVRYDGDTTPLVAEVAVELATLERRERAREVERLLRQRTQQVHELLQDAVRLSVSAGGRRPPGRAWTGRTVPAQRPAPDGLELAELLEPTHATVLDRDDRVQLALAELQAALAEQLGDAFEPHPGRSTGGWSGRCAAR
jgi:hypothetical protein